MKLLEKLLYTTCLLCLLTGCLGDTPDVEIDEPITGQVQAVEKETVSEETDNVIEIETEQMEKKTEPENLGNEELYYQLVHDFYEKLNELDKDAVMKLRYFTKDDDGKDRVKFYNKLYDKYLLPGADYYIPTGIKIFFGPEEVIEADGISGYRVRLMYTLEIIQRDENNNFVYSEYIEDRLYSQHQIYLMTISYENDEMLWKVLDEAPVATLRVHGENDLDWEKYKGATEDAGGWIAEYAEWYNEEFPIEE